MIVYREWNLNSFILSLLLLIMCKYGDSKTNHLSTELSIEQSVNADDDIHPYSLYYNKRTKSEIKRGITVEYGESMSDSSVTTFSCNNYCERLFAERINSKTNDIPDELFSRRIINMLLSNANFQNVGDTLVGKIIVDITPLDLIKLENFGKGKSSIRGIDSIITNIFKRKDEYILPGIITTIKHLLIDAMMHKDIIVGCLVIAYMTWIIITNKWNKLKLIIIMIIISLAASFIITWIQLVKEAEIKHTVKQVMYASLPKHCQPDKMSWWDKIWTTFSSIDDCYHYYEARMDIPFLQVTPTQALSHMIGACILQPSRMLGTALSDFTHFATRHLWGPVRVIIEPLLMIFILILIIIATICSAGGSIGWCLWPLSSICIKGQDHSTDNKRIGGTERKQPIEFILHHKVSVTDQQYGLSIESVKQDNDTSVTLVEEKITDNNVKIIENSTVSTNGEKSVLNMNLASGDSDSLNTSVNVKHYKCTNMHESIIEKAITETDGSGDN